MSRRYRSILAAGFASAALTPFAAPADPAGASSSPGFVPGEVLVRFEGGSERAHELPDGVRVPDAVRALARNPRVEYAAPNHVAHASASVPFIPNDRGTVGGAGGWQHAQWNFLPCGSTCGEQPAAPNLESVGGVDAPGAWSNLIEAKRPGGEGVTVAVVDTGVAYRSEGKRFRRSPDFKAKQFVPGHDFVEGDGVPLDENGHGTHIAGTIGERTHNKLALTGLAYGAKIMPVRVLNKRGEGTARNVARGIRWAASHGADVVNVSLEFCLHICKPNAQVATCADVPGVCEAIDAARTEGAVVFASAGNEGAPGVTYPGRHAIAVGGTTERACLAEYSNYGEGLDLVAPGGGSDAVSGGPQCVAFTGGRTILQLTLVDKKGGSFTNFGYPGAYEGSSMAAAHASGIAALVWARLAERLGRDPDPAEVEDRLRSTARHDGALANPALYGAGLLDAAAATAPP
jgi:serine protease